LALGYHPFLPTVIRNAWLLPATLCSQLHMKLLWQNLLISNSRRLDTPYCHCIVFPLGFVTPAIMLAVLENNMNNDSCVQQWLLSICCLWYLFIISYSAEGICKRRYRKWVFCDCLFVWTKYRLGDWSEKGIAGEKLNGTRLFVLQSYCIYLHPINIPPWF